MLLMCLNMYTSFKLHCLKQLPLFFNAAVVLEAFKELLCFTFARLFEAKHSVLKGNYPISPANPAPQRPSLTWGTQQRHFPKRPGCFCSPFAQDALQAPELRDALGADRPTIPALSAPATEPISDAGTNRQLVLTPFGWND